MKNTSYGGGRGYGNRSFGGGGFRSSGPKPVEVGKEYDVEISELSRRGDGIAKVSGFVIFVAGATAGQKAKIKITRVGNRFANGEIVTSGTEQEEGEKKSEE